MPSFYVNPEQLVREKAEYARRNIARGRPLIAVSYADGILLCAENTSATLHKISEIYDRIAFAGIGLYSEFDMLRRAGVQHADVKGYQFSREDVDARALATLYAQYLYQVFTHEVKPYEIEILVAEVGATLADDRMYRLQYDGIIIDEHDFAVLGGEAEAIAERMKETFDAGMSLDATLRAATAALSGPDRSIEAGDLEVAVLHRGQDRRAFRRVEDAETAQLLGSDDASG
jgi:proteasome alpha subunit